ncbi:MAG: phage portal protein [Rhodovibrionaceae bacterium]
MPLNNQQVFEAVEELKAQRSTDIARLDRIRNYLRDDPDRRSLEGLPAGTPIEMQRLARLSRVNMLKFVVNSRVQSMYVDGFRAPKADSDVDTWAVWQANGMDARQIGVHRAALSYGAAYVTVLPGDTAPVIRGASPRNLTVVYGDDDLWPELALEKRRSRSGQLWRLIDDEAVYWVRYPAGSDRPDDTVEVENHDAGRVPVVRYSDTNDLDDPTTGIVEPFIPLQDQINMTTFDLLVAQHYGAFKQRWIIGWLAESEEKRLKASASTLFTVDESPTDVQIGEWAETNLDGYIKSREATLKHLATVSQTPAHELIGEMVNISADALVAAESSKQRAIEENKRVIGEAHEQTLNLAGEMIGVVPDSEAFVRWQDSEARSLAQTVDALGKAVSLLGIPPQALWDRVADAMGVSQQEVEGWRAMAQSGDAFAGLEQMLRDQAEPPAEPAA